jgi:hypothetical protein
MHTALAYEADVTALLANLLIGEQAKGRDALCAGYDR